MFNQLINEISHKLSANGFTTEQIRTVSDAITVSMQGYMLQKECTEVAVYDGGMPKIMQYYLLDIASQNYSKGTIDNIRFRLQKFFNWVRKDPEDVKPNDIKAYMLVYNQVYTPIKDCTLEKHRQSICSFFRWAYEEDYLPEDISKRSKAIKHEKKKRSALTKDQFEIFRQACRTLEERTLVEVMYSTGVRAGELASIKVNDIDWKEKTIHIYGEKSKKWRDVYLSSSAAIYLKRHLDERKRNDEYVFCSHRGGGKVNVCSVESWIGKISDRCFDKINVNVTPHILRHTFATHAVHNGMPIEVVSTILGHASIQTTMCYVDMDNSSMQAMHSKYIA